MASQNKLRQEMIEMMYLVLTAMLALNVSKSILEAFVAIEENIQIANENAFARGNEKRAELEDVATDKSDSSKAKKATELLVAIKQVDDLTAKKIKFIDDLKLELFKAVGEDLTKTGDDAIITAKYDPKSPTKPIRINLNNVDAKDNFDVPMQVMGIANDLKRPTGNGLKLWNEMMSFRKDIVNIFVQSSPAPSDGQKYSFKDPNIVKFKDMKDLKKQVDAAIAKSVVPIDERDQIADLYMSLTKNQMTENIDKEKISWVGKTFDHSPMVAAISALSSVETEILTARANVISWIRNRVGGGEYSFNKVMSLAYAPDVVNANDSVTVQVLMAAYDSDKQPMVTVGGANVSDVHDGIGFVHMKAGATDLDLSGEITIKKRDGSAKTMPWEKKIVVMKPSASLTLPELMVLYKGYDNKVKGVASGYDQTVLSASGGISLVRSGDLYIARVPNGAGRTGTITVSGKSSVTGKTANLGTFTFDLKSLPAPDIFVNGKGNGGIITKNASIISAGYGPGIPLKANFTVLSWSFFVQGLPRPADGNGTTLNVRTILNQGRKGSKVAVEAKVKGPDGIVKTVSSMYTLQ